MLRCTDVPLAAHPPELQPGHITFMILIQSCHDLKDFLTLSCAPLPCLLMNLYSSLNIQKCSPNIAFANLSLVSSIPSPHMDLQNVYWTKENLSNVYTKYTGWENKYFGWCPYTRVNHILDHTIPCGCKREGSRPLSCPLYLWALGWWYSLIRGLLNCILSHFNNWNSTYSIFPGLFIPGFQDF